MDEFPSSCFDRLDCRVIGEIVMIELTELYEEFKESRRRNAATAPEASAPHDVRALVAAVDERAHGVPREQRGEVKVALE